MSAIFLLIGASLVVAVGFLIAFIWSVKDGQFEDDYTPAIRMLFENGIAQKKETPESSSTLEIKKVNTNKPIVKKQK